MGDRVIALSGGRCAVALPKQWQSQLGSEVDLDELNKVLGTKSHGMEKGMEIMMTIDSDQVYLSVPHDYCSKHILLTPQTHPELFSILALWPSKPIPDFAGSLPNAKFISTDDLKDGADKPMNRSMTSLEPTTLRLPKPRWHRGFDISGHAFLLTMSTLILSRELMSSWRQLPTFLRRYQRSNINVNKNPNPNVNVNVTDVEGRWSAGDMRKFVYRVSTICGTVLLGLWIWMIAMTAIWFHNPPEKLSGLGQ